MSELRMNAYYFAFRPTGVELVDRILSAVASAGKAYHHTESWNEPSEPYEPFRGQSHVEFIYNAAVDAAKDWAAKDERIGELEIKFRAADVMAKVADDWVKRKLIDPRSALADARLDYGDPYKYEAKENERIAALEKERDDLKKELSQELKDHRWTFAHSRELEQQDRIKTHEINVLVAENRALHAVARAAQDCVNNPAWAGVCDEDVALEAALAALKQG